MSAIYWSETKKKWRNCSNINITYAIRGYSIRETIVAKDDHINFTLTFHWDSFLRRLPSMIDDWLKIPKQIPSLIILGCAQHCIRESQLIYRKNGPQAAVVGYRQHLLKLRPSLVRLAASTRVVFKLVDHFALSMERENNKDALHDVSNYALFNEVAVNVLTGTGVAMWNSTLPLSYLYALECVRHPERRTLPTYEWNCPGSGHVGFIMVHQYTNMVLNDYCNRFRDLEKEDCL
ncbi:hypothetical protein Pcinc_024754 [Petrolisthes cinctipes]|uniref:Uncharacterized protein n=1 Tax=Petrolisthes cinctipes TaxID=88211 RepID=A0AAE1FAH9_PETCI|nr:hypothetical protein Pcinc_024754 [Petrolisthes cinctipes]